MNIASKGDGLLLSQTMVGSNADEEIPEMKDMEKQSITVVDLGDGGDWPDLERLLSWGSWGLEPTW